jgi:hypothetical protein
LKVRAIALPVGPVDPTPPYPPLRRGGDVEAIAAAQSATTLWCRVLSDIPIPAAARCSSTSSGVSAASSRLLKVRAIALPVGPVDPTPPYPPLRRGGSIRPIASAQRPVPRAPFNERVMQIADAPDRLPIPGVAAAVCNLRKSAKSVDHPLGSGKHPQTQKSQPALRPQRRLSHGWTPARRSATTRGRTTKHTKKTK